MHGFNHVTILSPSFQDVCKERLAQWPLCCDTKTTKQSGGTSRKIGKGHAARFLKPLPYFKPAQKFNFQFPTWIPGAWCVNGGRMTGCYGTYTVVGVITLKGKWSYRQMIKKVANSSKKHTHEFKTRMHKPYPISDQNGWNWYPISNQNG